MRHSMKVLASTGLLLLCGLSAEAQNPPKGLPKKDEPNPKPKIELGGKSLDHWIAEIRDRDPAVRENAIRTVTLFGQLARKAVPSLIAALDDRDSSPRVNAAIALGVIGMDQKDLKDGVNGLIKKLSDGQLIVRYQAILALAHLGPDAALATPYLISEIKNSYSSWECHKAAAFALGRTSGVPDLQVDVDPRAVRALTDTVQNDFCAQVRLEALQSLFRLGPPASWSIIDKSMLLQTMRNLDRYRDKTVVIWAYMVLMRFDDKVSEPGLAVIGKHLKSPELAVRTQAARALGMLGANGKSQVPHLIEALGDKDALVVLWTIAALKEMKGSAKAAIPALTKLNSHPSDEVKQLAKQAIDTINKEMEDKKPDKPKGAAGKDKNAAGKEKNPTE